MDRESGILQIRQNVYFNGHALKGNGHGYARDIETREIYWISGIKKDGQDRYWAGHGKIMIDREVVDEYLEITGSSFLDLKKFELVDIEKTDKQQFVDIENASIDSLDIENKYQDINSLSVEELESFIAELKRTESYTNNNNGKKFVTIKRIEAEKRLELLNNG